MSPLLPGVRVLRRGRVVAGGTPWRALVLTRPRAEQLRSVLAGEAPPAVEEQVLGLLARHGLASPAAGTGAGPSGTAPTAADVTLVVPVHDDVERLPRALASVPPEVRVVVVDDGSRRDVGEVARGLGAAVVRHEVPRGPAAARNSGLAEATTACVAFLDADVEADPSWLTTLLPHLAQDEVALVGPRIAARELEEPHVLARYEAAVSPLDRGPEPALVEARGRVDYLPSAALLARTTALRAIGGFDEALRFGEDADLCHRLSAAGWQVRYDPSAQVRHDHRTTWWAWLRRRYGYASGAAALAARHGTPQPPVPTAGALAAAWLLLGPGRLRTRTRWAARAVAVGAAATTTSAVGAGVPLPAAAEGAVRRELSGARRVVGLLPRQALLPVAVGWAVTTRRGRRVVPAAVVLQHLLQWRALERPLPPYAFVGLRVLDEAALSAGLWTACWRARTTTPLLPRLGGPPAVRREKDERPTAR